MGWSGKSVVIMCCAFRRVSRDIPAAKPIIVVGVEVRLSGVIPASPRSKYTSYNQSHSDLCIRRLASCSLSCSGDAK